MFKFLSLLTIVITLFGNSAYASESMKQFQDNLEEITRESRWVAVDSDHLSDD